MAVGTQPQVVLGEEADVKINNVLFGVVSGTIDWPAQDHECGDTISGVTELHKGGRVHMRIRLTAYNKYDVNVHAAALVILPRTYVDMKVYDRGLLYDPYTSDTMLVTNFQSTFSIDQNGQLTIEAISSGAFTVPSYGLVS